jgi:hypothetical protein
LFTEKVELAKHEVELANIKDIPRKLKSVLDSQKKLDKSMPELEKLKKDVEASYKRLWVELYNKLKLKILFKN